MARYTSGAWTTQDSLINAIDGVLTGESWTQDELNTTTNEAGWHKGNLYIQMSWNDSTNLNIFQSTGFSGTSTVPGSHTGDSGSDHIVRAIGNSGVNYHAFTDAGSGPTFAYFAIEYAAGFWRHFGFGNLVKCGGWSGGEFCYGHQWDQGTAIDEPNVSSHSIFFDGQINAAAEAATIKIVGSEWPNAPASCVWGVSHAAGTIGNDTAGNGRYRMMGGVRQGPYVQQFGVIDMASGSAPFIPGSPIPVIARDPTNTTPQEHWMWMGELPLLYLGSMLNLTPAQQLTVGSETWRVFPIVRQAFSAGSGLEQTGNGAVFYREA